MTNALSLESGEDEKLKLILMPLMTPVIVVNATQLENIPDIEVTADVSKFPRSRVVNAAQLLNIYDIEVTADVLKFPRSRVVNAAQLENMDLTYQ
jgi:hypothetical protein